MLALALAVATLLAQTLPPVANDDAVIRASGSTNTSGYTIVVHPDFSADIYDRGSARHALVDAPQAKWLFAKLREDAPFSSLGAGHCMKSASFGTTTSIAFGGDTTPDLSCPGSPASRELNRTVGAIVDRLGIQPAIGRFRRRML